MNLKIFIYSILCLALVACGSDTPPEMEVNRGLPDIFPDYVDVTIPAEIAPMNFNLLGLDESATMYVKVTGSKGGQISASGAWADFDIDDWHELTEANRGGTLTFDVYARSADGEWVRYEPFEMHVSQYPLSDYGITYRKIAPGFETFSKIGVYERRLADFDERPILEETAVNGQCVNCHYANRGNPDQYSLHVRGASGGTILRTTEGTRYLNTRTDSTQANCTYGYWHPDGRYCVYSLNRIYQNFYVGTADMVEPWDAVSDIAVLDTQSDELIIDRLLMTPDCETTPAFSADGMRIYYCYAPAANLPAEYDKLRYSLCAVDFDPQSGRIGERIDTIICTDSIGKSVSLPRPSYDGRYIMYCLTSYGTTPVDHRDSDLWLLDLATGQSRELTELNSPEADAYHNWSSDSRWLLFGSRRHDGMYAQVFFACMGDDGRATKPFLLPQRNPLLYYSEALHAFNAPDFTTRAVDLDPVEIRQRVASAPATPISAR